MRTYDFKKSQEISHSNFLPVQTIVSEEFGRHFFIDANFEFISAPSFESGGYDESQLGFVSEWTDWEGVNMEMIFEIYRKMAAEFHYDEILKERV